MLGGGNCSGVMSLVPVVLASVVPAAVASAAAAPGPGAGALAVSARACAVPTSWSAASTSTSAEASRRAAAIQGSSPGRGEALRRGNAGSKRALEAGRL